MMVPINANISRYSCFSSNISTPDPIDNDEAKPIVKHDSVIPKNRPKGLAVKLGFVQNVKICIIPSITVIVNVE